LPAARYFRGPKVPKGPRFLGRKLPKNQGIAAPALSRLRSRIKESGWRDSNGGSLNQTLVKTPAGVIPAGVFHLHFYFLSGFSFLFASFLFAFLLKRKEKEELAFL